MTSSQVLTNPPGGPVDDLPPLRFDRTVDRTLVHRAALAEVFLTDVQELDGSTYAAAAQLPRLHAYYTDHLLRPASHDPVLLLEACRQAALAGAHLYYGVPTSAKFILTHLSIELTPPSRHEDPTAPCPLSLLVKVVDRRVRDGVTTGLDHELRLAVRGVEIGRASLGLRFRMPADYAAMRLKQRGGARLLSSATLPADRTGAPVHPHLVGRASPDNVVLVDADAGQDGVVRARLAVPARHASMFDHPQDHLPGMVLAEAARQAACYAALEHRSESPVKVAPVAMHLTFQRFGELDTDAAVTARIPDSAGAGGGAPVEVDFTQAGESICTASVRLARLAA
jgi:2-oxo-3-(phosphooxy)propyl 3-oxoalkanoate synthase